MKRSMEKEKLETKTSTAVYGGLIKLNLHCEALWSKKLIRFKVVQYVKTKNLKLL